ncbi:MAG: hypothetical protein RLZZ352_122 [Pseudomonadota bacterium]
MSNPNSHETAEATAASGGHRAGKRVLALRAVSQ